MPLPVSASLSLLEAAQFVMEKTGESEASVHDALKEAGLTGALTATGYLHLSAHPDLARYFAHDVLNEREPVPPGAWSLTISWQTATEVKRGAQPKKSTKSAESTRTKSR
jgi:hypothetical protein